MAPGEPRTFQAYLDGPQRRYSCRHCQAHLASHDALVSKVTGTAAGKLTALGGGGTAGGKLTASIFSSQSFQGSQGRAYLFDSV